MKILIINGPNLNLLGKREPEIYGHQTFESYFESLKKEFSSYQIDCFQTNHEGSIIDKLQEADNKYDGVVLNAAGYTHTSISIGDTIKAISIPVVEVHISDISKREDYRKYSYVAEGAVNSIAGEGLKGYKMAIDYLLRNS